MKPEHIAYGVLAIIWIVVPVILWLREVRRDKVGL
jgi:hypothetical protein